MRLNRLACRWPCWLATVTVAWPLWAGAEDSYEQRVQRLHSMTAEEMRELVRKKDRFDALSAEEQQRLRQLHEQIAQDADAQQLRQTLVSYNEWLKTLTAGQRAELAGLPPEARIAKIRELKQYQEERIFRLFNEIELPPDDVRKIMFWANSYIQRYQDEILSWMPSDYQQHAHSADAQRRRRMVLYALAHRPPDKNLPPPDQAEMRNLLSRLSPETRQILSGDPNMKQKVARWFEQLGTARLLPPTTEEELQQFFQEHLNDEERQRLDFLSIEERKNELRRMYNIYRFRQRDAWDGRPGLPPNGKFPRPRLGTPDLPGPGNGPPPVEREQPVRPTTGNP